jgi:hypothetical protein
VKLKMRGRLFPFLLLLLIFPGYADAQLEGCLSYDPAVVKLAGTISKKTFPGPPNYESIRKGDQPETYRVLHLASPICTTASGDNEAESGVTDLQLILTRKQYALSKKFAGRRVRMTVTGKLSHAITGHHHTPVLLEVTGISSVR